MEDLPPITRIVANMPWPASCRYCDLVTEDPDAYFRPPDIEVDEWTACRASPTRVHEPRGLSDYGFQAQYSSS